jgi:hypothetical protein
MPSVRQKPSNRVERVTNPGRLFLGTPPRTDDQADFCAWCPTQGRLSAGVGLAEMEGPREDDATADRRFDLLTGDQKTVGFPATHATKRALIPS